MKRILAIIVVYVWAGFTSAAMYREQINTLHSDKNGWIVASVAAFWPLTGAMMLADQMNGDWFFERNRKVKP